MHKCLELINQSFVIKGQQKKRWYNVLALSNDCVLLPSAQRHKHIWHVPSAKRTKSFGFGQSLIWYASEETAIGYI